MTIRHCFQDAASTECLLDELLKAASGAERGGGLFAWTSAYGVTRFFGDPAFENLVATGSFHLIFGLDAVTDTRALTEVQRYVAIYPGLTAHALLHSGRTFFHPKVAWFAGSTGITWITGSGNLTYGGLRENWESFSVYSGDARDAANLEADLAAYLGGLTEYLFEIDDPRVLARAAQNDGGDRRDSEPDPLGNELPAPPVPAPTRRSASGATVPLADNVFIQEVSKGRGGLADVAQADVGKTAFEDFFGSVPSAGSRVLLYMVRADGSLGEVEERSRVSTASGNYRLELAAGKGRPYPSDDRRPISAFLRLPGDIYLYRLALPGDSDYEAIRELLYRRTTGPAGRMRRDRLSLDVLASEIPDSPLVRADRPQ